MSATFGLKAGNSPGAGYKEYTALLTQSGTDAPVATVLVNTLGGEVVWSYVDVGDYLATLAGAFTENRTWFSFPSPRASAEESGEAGLALINANTVRLTTAEADTLKNQVLSPNFSIQIRVYPA